MQENRRDSGLVRAIGPVSLAASMVGMVIGASIFVLPSTLAACVGPFAPLEILVCALAVGAVAVCFAVGGSRLPSSGGPYAYIQAAFGPLAGYVAGTLLWYSDVLACGAIAAALGDVAASMVLQSLHRTAQVIAIAGVLGGIAWVNIRGVALGARLVTVSTSLKLIPLAIFIVAGLFAVNADNFTVPVKLAPDGIGRAFILSLFAFTGMETSLCASGEVSSPSRTIPRALALAMASVTLVYVSIQVVCQGILGDSLAHSTAPLVDSMARISPLLRTLIFGGAALSIFGFLSSDILGSPRILYAIAKDGLLPSFLGNLHSRYRTPHIAILCYSALAIVLALSGTFAELAILAALATAGLYILGCAAAWRLARLNVRWLGAAAMVGIVAMLLLIALASRAEILGLIGLIGASVVVYLVQTRRSMLGRR